LPSGMRAYHETIDPYVPRHPVVRAVPSPAPGP
jgi:hypothetical protein